MKSILSAIPREAWLWTAGLVGLAVLAPSLENSVTLCVPTLLGFDGCWGCGLGRSIGQLAHGEVTESFASHPFGIPAVLVISARIVHLVRQSRTVS
ncbi:MAG: DUF2752 domain-containing protein [Ignavibacteria bacterium]|nr:DUF2752 domain-containing protein [Ignavibacteria bacterium]MBP7093511.1 DUF2752 domain-containing protein [Candidatus Kapabacteria bacterium]MBK6419757.1 DUF2752 domain-containing protein [Ignavibacteria bacterium]MBK6759612.1 DUF2752 domain-containing protein [Ignavibacteria bacterium]MBK7033203.1 DUF2752 domain-containing protein [Ignavibacteria bacterium]